MFPVGPHYNPFHTRKRVAFWAIDSMWFHFCLTICKWRNNIPPKGRRSPCWSFPQQMQTHTWVPLLPQTLRFCEGCLEDRFPQDSATFSTSPNKTTSVDSSRLEPLHKKKQKNVRALLRPSAPAGLCKEHRRLGRTAEFQTGLDGFSQRQNRKKAHCRKIKTSS